MAERRRWAATVPAGGVGRAGGGGGAAASIARGVGGSERDEGRTTMRQRSAAPNDAQRKQRRAHLPPLAPPAFPGRSPRAPLSQRFFVCGSRAFSHARARLRLFSTASRMSPLFPFDAVLRLRHFYRDPILLESSGGFNGREDCARFNYRLEIESVDFDDRWESMRTARSNH